MARGRRAWIRKEARRALLLAGAQRPDQIDPIQTAKALEIELAYGGITGAAERISMLAGRGRIRITDAIVQPGRRSFTTAHAIGHFVCGHTIASDGGVDGWIQYACSRRGSVEERESDVFATEHLTPAPWTRPYCEVDKVDLEAVRTISRVFPVSPVMAAMRFVELTHHACAVVYAEARAIRWWKGSRAFPARMFKKAPVPSSSIAHEFFETGAISDRTRTIAARAWLPSSERITETTEMIEHAEVVPEPGWGGVLSLLWIPSIAPRVKHVAA